MGQLNCTMNPDLYPLCISAIEKPSTQQHCKEHAKEDNASLHLAPAVVQIFVRQEHGTWFVRTATEATDLGTAGKHKHTCWRFQAAFSCSMRTLACSSCVRNLVTCALSSFKAFISSSKAAMASVSSSAFTNHEYLGSVPHHDARDMASILQLDHA